MSKILVSGLINLETTLKINSFPVKYEPVRYPFFGVKSSVSGVGYNIAKALAVLGNKIDFVSIIGKDAAGKIVKNTISINKISSKYIIEEIEETPQSVIIFDECGKRAINTDLKNIQGAVYPQNLFNEAINECNFAVLCNINFSRPFLKKTKKLGKPVATDLHAISDINDKYNRDFMEYADILFLSDEKLPCKPEEFAGKIKNKFGAGIIVVGLGAKGVLLCVREDNFCERIPCVKICKIVNTIGAGDALFSAFVHFYNKTGNPYEAVNAAQVFAAHKIGATGGADGFLKENQIKVRCLASPRCSD